MNFIVQSIKWLRFFKDVNRSDFDGFYTHKLIIWGGWIK